MEKINITPGSGVNISQTGTFDFNSLYSGITKFFSDNGYPFHEKEHSEKNTPFGKKIGIKFEADKIINNVVKQSFEVKISLSKIKPEANMLKGQIRVSVKSYIGIDHKEEWSDKQFKKFLLKLNQEYIRGEEIDYYGNNLLKDTGKLVKYIKEVLNLID